MNPNVLPVRPVLTMPPVEADALREAYDEARVILEYGSGGSTALASDMPGKIVFSVESDRAWAEMMGAWLCSSPRQSAVHIHHADIGPTGPWGFPTDLKTIKTWSRYPEDVWQRSDFLHPDVVLIDGRFRVACFLTVVQRIDRAVEVLFDDYVDRKPYHRVEEIVAPVEQVGRMARFQLRPGQLSIRGRLMRARALRQTL